MKKVIVVIMVLLIVVMPWKGSIVLGGSPYPVEWLRQFGTTSSDYPYGVTTDASGNIYVAGWTYGTFTGQTKFGWSDAFVRKYNSAGVLQWSRHFGVPGNICNTHIRGITLDSVGYIYVAGYTNGALPGQTYAGGGNDAFVCKFSNDGVMLWTRQFGTSYEDSVKGVAVDSAGNIYVGGKTAGTLPGQTSSGDIDAFVRKYNSDGVEQWTRQFGTPRTEHTWGIAADASGNSYLIGETNGAFPVPHPGSWDAFMRKYNSDGVEQWTRQFGTVSSDTAYGVAVDGSGNIYVVGYTSGAFPGYTSSGGHDAFVRKYNSAGVEQWTRQFGTTSVDEAYSVAADASGNAYVVGNTQGALPGQTSSGGIDAFVRMYDSNGVEIWTYQFGTATNDEAHSTAVDLSGAVYVVGWTAGAFPGYTNSGNNDAFLVKFTPPSVKLALTGYRWSTVYSPKGQVAPYPATLMTWQQVQLSNSGTENAFNVTATITSVPANVTVTDGQVIFGDIPSGGSAWSTDDFALVTNMTQTQTLNPVIVWRVEYDDASGNHHVIENVQ